MSQIDATFSKNKAKNTLTTRIHCDIIIMYKNRKASHPLEPGDNACPIFNKANAINHKIFSKGESP